MRIADAIARIKAQCPGFAYVDHLLTSSADFDRPAALVAPVRVVGVDPRIFIPGGYSQDVSWILGVYIVLDRRQNGVTGSGTADLFDDLTTSLRAALVNWSAPATVQPLTYAGGEMAPYGTGLVTWREDFTAISEMRFP